MTAPTDQLKAERRLRRFLEKGQAQLRPGATGQMLIEDQERGVIGVPAQALSRLVGSGAVVVRGSRIALAEGRTGKRRQSDRSDKVLGAPKRETEEMAIETDAGSDLVMVNVAESPLALLWRHTGKKGERFLTPAEFRAGERLRADYSKGQIMARMGVNWMAAGGSGRRHGDTNGIADLTDAALSARQRVERAIDAVGPELAGVLLDICCFLKGLERVEAERGWPVRSGKVVLKSALSALARHYEPGAQSRDRKVLHWGSEDYRPFLRKNPAVSDRSGSGEGRLGLNPDTLDH